ncbi:o-succinylbenzoate synthase [Corynebacterium glucuronolyticum]
MVTFEEIAQRARVVDLPMIKFRGITHREAMLIEGPKGWAEWSPFLEYETPEAATWLKCALEVAYVGVPTQKRTKVQVNGTVPAVAAGEVENILARFPGVKTVKVKVAERGQSLQDDIERVQEVRRLMPEATIRVDANRGWSVDQAIEAAKWLGPLEYMEQPCATIEELEQVRPYVKVAADESIRKESDPLKVKGRVDYAILKCQPMGGPTNVLKVEKELRLRVTVSSALETAVGMYACLATAAAQDVQPAAGLGTGGFFYEDVAERRQIVDGAIDVTPVTPTNFPACKNEDFWYRRLKECLGYLQSRS